MIHFLERNWSKLIKNKNETHLTHASYENIAKTSRKEQISGYHAHSFFLDYCIHMWDHKGYIVPSTCCDKSALRYSNFLQFNRFVCGHSLHGGQYITSLS